MPTAGAAFGRLLPFRPNTLAALTSTAARPMGPTVSSTLTGSRSSVASTRFGRLFLDGLLAEPTGPSRVDRWRFATGDGPAQPDPAELANVLDHLEPLSWLHDRLADRESRTLLLEVLLHRVLGGRRRRLPLDTDEFWAVRDQLEPTLKIGSSPHSSFLGPLSWFGLGGQEGPIEVLTHPLGLLNTFVVQQYVCQTAAGVIAPRPGDVVVDGGACWGDTTLWYADLVGPSGQVHAFEIDPQNLAVLAENLDRNPALAGRVTVVDRALGERTGDTVTFDATGPGTRLGSGTTHCVETLTVDDHVARTAGRLDVLKLDVEGAELSVLEGARRSIERHRPLLAISAYHRPDDLVVLPAFVAGLDVDYQLFLRHATNHREETVLFAVPGDRVPGA